MSTHFPFNAKATVLLTARYVNLHGRVESQAAAAAPPQAARPP